MLTKNNEGVEPAREQVLDKLLENIPIETEVVLDLPSEGKFYPGFKQVSITPMTFEHEKLIISNIKKDIDPINLLLSNCVKGIPIPDLLLFDKLFILMKIRELSYGDTYKFSLDCPKCQKESIVEMSFKNLLINKISPEITDPRIITLPVAKKKIKVRFPRVKDEQYLMDPELASNSLYRFVEAVENYTDPVLITQFIKKLPIKDIKTIINEINRPDLGLDPRIIFECRKCGKDSEVAIPITTNFFSVN